MSTARKIRGENRFYNPPTIRKLQQELEKKRLEQEKEAKAKETLDRQKEEEEEEEKRPLPASDECSTSDCSVPGRVEFGAVSRLPMTSTKGWRPEYCPYFYCWIRSRSGVLTVLGSLLLNGI